MTPRAKQGLRGRGKHATIQHPDFIIYNAKRIIELLTISYQRCALVSWEISPDSRLETRCFEAMGQLS
jgi:hypothetical protein